MAQSFLRLNEDKTGTLLFISSDSIRGDILIRLSTDAKNLWPRLWPQGLNGASFTAAPYPGQSFLWEIVKLSFMLSFPVSCTPTLVSVGPLCPASSSSTMLSFTAPAAVRSRSPPQSGSFPQHPGPSSQVLCVWPKLWSLLPPPALTPSDF